MIRSVLLALVALAIGPFLPGVARAQAEQQDTRKFFSVDYIDYWKSGWLDRERQERLPVASPNTANPLRWIERTIEPDGTVKEHVPPEPVLKLLENPTEENAIAYLEWQKERIRRLRQAQEILAQVQARLRIQKIARSINDSPTRPEITFYTKPGCPYCATQAELLQPVIKQIAGLAVHVRSVRDVPAEVQALGIQSVPTLILRVGPNTTRMTGLTRTPKLLRALELLLAKETSDAR